MLERGTVIGIGMRLTWQTNESGLENVAGIRERTQRCRAATETLLDIGLSGGQECRAFGVDLLSTARSTDTERVWVSRIGACASARPRLLNG